MASRYPSAFFLSAASCSSGSQSLSGKPLCRRRAVSPREVRNEAVVTPDHHLHRRVPELLRDPADVLARREHQRRERVPSLVHRAVAEARASERRLPHALAQVGHVERAAVAVREDPRRAQLARGALGKQRAFDRGEHCDVADRRHCLRWPLAESVHGTPDAERLALPVMSSHRSPSCSPGRTPVKNATVKYRRSPTSRPDAQIPPAPSPRSPAPPSPRTSPPRPTPRRATR